MNQASRTLLVYEDEPSLSLVLGEQLDRWQIRSISPSPGLAGQTGDAALLATDGDHGVLAADLRDGGMIGPIFSLGDGAPQPPLIGLTKPFRISAFLARLKAHDPAWVDGAVIGPWRLDVTQKALLWRGGDRIERLTDKELALLQLILVTMPHPVDRETLQTEIWKYHAEADTHTVETHVWRLRQKLEDDPSNPGLLVTMADGYTLNTR